ncbi:MAG: hypothetical protein ACREQV_21045 [Candidatus Binatia bacterium]
MPSQHPWVAAPTLHRIPRAGPERIGRTIRDGTIRNGARNTLPTKELEEIPDQFTMASTLRFNSVSQQVDQ